jgi:hypothetical protein
MFCKNCEGNNAITEQRMKCAFFNEMTMGVGGGGGNANETKNQDKRKELVRVLRTAAEEIC